MRIRHIMWSGTLLAWFLLAESAIEAQFTRDDWNRADEATVRLSPSAFANVPAAVRTELERRGCTVPQPGGEGRRNLNVVSGEFTSAGQKEWAVLCSRQRRSALVFHASASNEIEELAEQPDVQYLQVSSGVGKIGYSRQLATATPRDIRRHFMDKQRFSRNIDHDGVEDTFIEKASVVWYHIGNKCMKLSRED